MQVLPLWNIWMQPMKWEYCYIDSFFITFNITAHGSAARVSRPISLFPRPPLRKDLAPRIESGIEQLFLFISFAKMQWHNQMMCYVMYLVSSHEITSGNMGMVTRLKLASYYLYSHNYTDLVGAGTSTPTYMPTHTLLELWNYLSAGETQIFTKLYKLLHSKYVDERMTRTDFTVDFHPLVKRYGGQEGSPACLRLPPKWTARGCFVNPRA